MTFKEKAVGPESIPVKRVDAIIGRFADTIDCDINTKALIVSAEGEGNNFGLAVGQAFIRQINQRNGEALLATHRPFGSQEPRDEGINQLLSQNFNLIIITDLNKLGYDANGRNKPYILAGQEHEDILWLRNDQDSTRVFWFMVNDLNRFLDTVDIDYQDLSVTAAKYVRALQLSKKVVIESGNNLQLEIKTDPRFQARADFSFMDQNLGKGGNVPPGEVLVTPDSHGTEGSILINGSFYTDRTVTVNQPVRLDFRRGRVVNIHGGKEANLLEEYLLEEEKRTKAIMAGNDKIGGNYLVNIRQIAEFAIGINPKAVFCDDLLIDEKVKGSAHIAIGSSYDGEPAFNHNDLIVRQPKVIFIDEEDREKTVVEAGQLLL